MCLDDLDKNICMSRECHKKCFCMSLIGIKISKFTEHFTWKHNENNDLAFIPDVDLPVLHRKMKINKN